MGLMTGFAGEAAGVLAGVDLGEGFGFGGAGGVAADAEDGGVKLGRGDGRVVGVVGQGAVAGFAVDVGVLAGGFDGENVGVAGFAGLVSGKFDGPGGDLGDGGPAIMAVLSEAPGHDEVTNDEKHYEGDDEEKGKSKEMSCIFEAIHRAISPSAWEPACAASDDLIDRVLGTGLYVTGSTGVWCARFMARVSGAR